MRIVSENSEAVIARNTATADVDNSLRELTANLLRAARGAGRAWKIGRQAQALIDSLIKYRQVVGAYPSTDEIIDALEIWRNQDDLKNLSDEHYEQASAEQAVIRGALRIVAARLLDQRLQGAAGESEMYRGLGRLEAIRTAKAVPAATGIVKSAITITIFPDPRGGYVWSARHHKPPLTKLEEPHPEDQKAIKAWFEETVRRTTHKFDRSREPIAMSENRSRSIEGANRAARRWLKTHGHHDETNTVIAEQPKMSARLDAWIENTHFRDWGIAPIGDLLAAASRIGSFSIEGNVAAGSYNIDLLFEDGSAYLLGDYICAQSAEEAT
jgi:hypothetical protein